jgi:amidase
MEINRMSQKSQEPLWRCDAVELAHLIRTRQVSAREVVDAHLERIEAVNPRLNAIVLTLADEARAAAEAADAAMARGDALGPLHGVPVTTKVNTDQAGCPTDNGVEALKSQVAEHDSPTVANFKKAGAIIIGRTNTPAFSMRWLTENALHGVTLNPWHAGHTAGGSSGGAASSVAAGMAPIGQGNDIAGSVRYPAYCCGLVGLRPSYGRVPAYNPTAPGGRAITSQLMAVQGPLTRTVCDARVALAVMAAGDPNDVRWVDVPLVGPAAKRPIRVALVPNPAGRGASHVSQDAVRAAGVWLDRAGYAVEEHEPPELGAVADLWAKLAMDDVIARLEPAVAQHGDDGIRQALALWREMHPPAGPQGVLDALVERDRVLRLWQLFLEEVPLIVMPSSSEVPFPVGYDCRDLATTQHIWRAQLPQLAIPVLGLPAVAVPTGLHQGLPTGVQVVAGRYREDLCLDAAEIILAQSDVEVPVD